MELAVLRRHVDRIEPDHVVFYHGANDFFYAWERQMGAVGGLVLVDTPLNRLRARLKQSYLIAFVRRLLGAVDIDTPPPEAEAVVDDAIESYSTLRRQEDELCARRGLACSFFLQPIVTSKDPMTYIERVRAERDLSPHPGYGTVYDRFGDQLIARFPDTHDLRSALDGLDEPVFLDMVHINGSGNERLARAIFAVLPPELVMR